MTFGQRLRQIRKERNVSQRALAEMVSVNPIYISQIETGIHDPPSAVVIGRIAQALETDERELFYLAGKVPPDLAPALKDNPLLTELVCLLAQEPLSDAAYRVMIGMVKFKEMAPASAYSGEWDCTNAD